MFTSSQCFFVVSNVQLLKSRHHGVEIGPQVLWQLIVPGGLTSAGVHGVQGIQTVTLGSRRKLRFFLVLELVLPIRAFLMTIAGHERIKLELSAQAVWQFPTFSRKEVQLLCTCPDRSLTNFSVWVVPCSSSISNTSPLSFMRMFAPSWRIIVIGVSGGMNCCLPSADMGSSQGKPGTRPCRLRSRSHHRLLCSSVRQATSWSQDQTNKLRVLWIGVASHNSLGRTIKQHVR